jgi:hypothetical protein
MTIPGSVWVDNDGIITEEEARRRMNKVNTTYVNGYDAGYKARSDELRAEYDAWRRARQRANMTGTTYELQDIAVRQVIYGNETGTPPHETEQEKET